MLTSVAISIRLWPSIVALLRGVWLEVTLRIIKDLALVNPLRMRRAHHFCLMSFGGLLCLYSALYDDWNIV